MNDSHKAEKEKYPDITQEQFEKRDYLTKRYAYLTDRDIQEERLRIAQLSLSQIELIRSMISTWLWIIAIVFVIYLIISFTGVLI